MSISSDPGRLISGSLPRLLPKLAATWAAPKAATVNIPVREHGVQIAWLMGVAERAAELIEAMKREAERDDS